MSKTAWIGHLPFVLNSKHNIASNGHIRPIKSKYVQHWETEGSDWLTEWAQVTSPEWEFHSVHRQAFCCFSWNPGHENWEKSWNPGQNFSLMLSASWIPLEFNSRRDAAYRVKHKVVESRKFMISAIWLVHFAKLTFLWNPGLRCMPTARTAKHLLLESTTKSVESGTNDVICQFCTVKGMVVESEILKALCCALSK